MLHENQGNTKKKGRGRGFRIRGVIQELESGHGAPGLIVEACDKDLVRNDRLGSAVTDKEGRFELSYRKKDYKDLFIKKKPDLYLRISRPDGAVIHKTEDKVRYQARGTKPFIIKIPKKDLSGVPVIQSASVSPELAKADERIEITLLGQSGGRARFSIGKVYSATDVPMTEKPEESGTYLGIYTVKIGDNVEDAPVTVIFTSRTGETVCRECDQRVTIDTIPPRIFEANLASNVISNDQMVGLSVVAEPNCHVSADISKIDTTQNHIPLQELSEKPGVYEVQILISAENKAPNGLQNVSIVATDAVGNQSDATILTVELRNSELHLVRGLDGERGKRLNKVGIVTLADLRRMAIGKVAVRTDMQAEELARYRASATLQSLGATPEVAAVLSEKFSSVGALAMSTEGEVTGMLGHAIEERRVEHIADARDVARQLTSNAQAVVDAMLVSHTHASVSAANECGEECQPRDSVFGCRSYLLDLIKSAGFTRTDQLRQQFGWDVTSAGEAPTRRTQICIEILKGSVQIDERHPAQIEYEQNLFRALLGITARTASELTADPLYGPALANRSLREQNQQLLLLLRQQANGERVEAVLAALEPLELQALIAQSGKTSEQLCASYFISFAPGACNTMTRCEHAILVLQAYLAKKTYEASKKRIPVATYDNWRLEKASWYYPESIYGNEFKQPLIQGQRERLRQHLQEARGLLEVARLTSGGAPSSDDPSTLLSSLQHRSIYYNNILAGLHLLEDCLRVDDLMLMGHRAFFDEEFQLARLYYFQAAGLIRQVSRALSSALKLPPLSPFEPEIQESMADASEPSEIWMSDRAVGNALIEATSAAISTEATRYMSNMYLAYQPENIPGVALARGRVSIGGVNADGTIAMVSSAEFNENGWWEVILDARAYVPLFHWEVSPGLSSGAVISSPSADDYQTYPSMSFLVYAPSASWTDYVLEIDLRSAVDVLDDREAACQDFGLVFRYQISRFAYLEMMNGGGMNYFGLGTYYMNPGVPLAPGTGAPVLIPEYQVPTNVESDHIYRLRCEVHGNAVKVCLMKPTAAGQGFWDQVATVPLKEPDYQAMTNLPSGGAFGLASFLPPLMPSSKTNRTYQFQRISVWDLSPAHGAFSDLAFFMKPAAVSSRQLLFDVYTPKKKLNLVSVSNGAGVLCDPSSTPAYDLRQVIYGGSDESLAGVVSVAYAESDYIVSPTGEEPTFDPFWQGAKELSEGLWYGGNDQRLIRSNLRRLADRLPNLFVHQYFFLLPVCLGDVANALGEYEEALNWYRMVYDDREADVQKCAVYPFLNDAIEYPLMTQRIAKNYLEWGDHLFQENTRESLQLARRKYKRVIDLLGSKACCGVEFEEQSRSLATHLSRSSLNAHQSVTIWTRVAELSNASIAAARSVAQQIMGELTDGAPQAEMMSAIERHLANSDAAVRSSANHDGWLPPPDVVERRFAGLEDANPAVLDNFERAHQIARQSVQQPPMALEHPDEQRASSTSPVVAHAGDIIASSQAGRAAARALLAVLPSAGTFQTVRPTFDEWLAIPLVEPFVTTLYQNDRSLRTSAVGRRLHAGDRLIDFLHDFCVPPNPSARALVERACLGIRHIDQCFNVLGFPQNDISVYRFDYLLGLAKGYANLALAAEKEFIEFKGKYETSTLELRNASQTVSLAQAGVQLADLRIQDALDHVAVSYEQIAAVNAHIEQVETQIHELRNSWSVLGIVLGALGAAVSAGPAAPAAMAISGTAGLANYEAGIEDKEKGLRAQLDLLRTADYPAARLGLLNAVDQHRSVQQQAMISRLEAQFAAERATSLAFQFFNPQLWSFLAREMKKNYRTYLQYSAIAAWLAQRALEFERGIEPRLRFASTWPDGTTRDNSLNIIRFDYYEAARQGLLAADSLMRDITTLEQERLLTEQRKLKITKVISLAQTSPLEFAGFQQSGKLAFGTDLLDFDIDYPGHYQRRIKDVWVNVFGLVGPEGIKATLTHLGPSRVVVREWDTTGKAVFAEKTLAHPIVTVAVSNPQPGGIGKVTLSPEEPMLRPFEGKGVAGRWTFEMLKMSNAVDFNTITDIQLVMEYTALFSDEYRQEVLDRLPKTRTAIRPYTFCADFSDACFHLKEGTRPIGMIKTDDGITGANTLALKTRESDFPPNQNNRRLKEVVAYFQSKDNSTDFSHLKIYLSCKQRLGALEEPALTLMQPVQPSNATMVKATSSTDDNAYDPGKHYLGKWEAEDLNIRGNVGVVDTWYLNIPPDPHPPQYSNSTFIKKDKSGNPVLVNGHKLFDFSGLQDVIFALHYEFDVDLPPLNTKV